MRLNWMTYCWVGSALILGGPSCGEAIDPSSCVPGASAACACSNGNVGVQVCNEHGTYDACRCEVGTSGGANGANGGSAGITSGGFTGLGGISGSAGIGGVGGANAGNAGMPGASGGEATAGAGGESSAGGPSNEGGASPGGHGGDEGGAPEGGSAGSASHAGAGGASAEGGSAGSGGAPCPIVEPEWCDGVDNDCDGTIDNGEVCPDDTVSNTEPFDGGVYLQGTTKQGYCGFDALQRFWPTLADDYFTGFDCYASSNFKFRTTDDVIFYTATTKGLFQDSQSGPDTLVVTPPCGAEVYQFGFDEAETLYYLCGSTLRRGNGQLVAQNVNALTAVLGDGRTIVTRDSSTHGDQDYVVLSTAGDELSRLHAQAEFDGALTPNVAAASVSGRHGYVAYQRYYGQEQREALVYRVTEDNVWQRVRRARIPSFGAWMLVISDGTVFLRDPTINESQITAYHPDGTESVVWQEPQGEAPVRTWSGRQLLIGPP